LIYFDTGKAFLENRQNLLCIDLRKRAVKIERPPFLQCLLVNLVQRLTASWRCRQPKQKTENKARNCYGYVSFHCQHVSSHGFTLWDSFTVGISATAV
jgi:hypothetical protein